ncbi:MAG TPA: molybdate ABC transporter substrate-binding protein [Thermoanaerobaculia bacterium]|nr:molybdate ABC transporter substrate-binding protein [Thermoanaerobaculia bacterium]
MRFVLLLLLALPLSAAEVRVLAAASLTDALQEIARAYEKQSGDRIVFSFGASNLLARQIAAGAPADLFLSADEASMNRVQTSVRVNVLSNTLVVIGKPIRRPRDLVNLKSIALAEPSSVPAGIYARQWLERLRLWDAVKPKVIPTDNVRSALAAVASGNADAAIVYKTDARISKKVRVTYVVRDGPRITYPFAVLRGAEQPAAARRFLAYLRGKPALDTFARHGFDVLR